MLGRAEHEPRNYVTTNCAIYKKTQSCY